jgi:hypothetical protein
LRFLLYKRAAATRTVVFLSPKPPLYLPPFLYQPQAGGKAQDYPTAGSPAVAITLLLPSAAQCTTVVTPSLPLPLSFPRWVPPHSLPGNTSLPCALSCIIKRSDSSSVVSKRIPAVNADHTSHLFIPGQAPTPHRPSTAACASRGRLPPLRSPSPPVRCFYSPDRSPVRSYRPSSPPLPSLPPP